MNVGTIMIVWAIWDIFMVCYCCSLAVKFGVKLGEKFLNPLLSLFSIIFNIVVFVLLLDSGAWWYPIVLHFIFIAPIIRAIYDV